MSYSWIDINTVTTIAQVSTFARVHALECLRPLGPCCVVKTWVLVSVLLLRLHITSENNNGFTALKTADHTLNGLCSKLVDSKRSMLTWNLWLRLVLLIHALGQKWLTVTLYTQLHLFPDRVFLSPTLLKSAFSATVVCEWGQMNGFPVMFCIAIISRKVCWRCSV